MHFSDNSSGSGLTFPHFQGDVNISMRPNYMQHRAVARTPQLHTILLLINETNILRGGMQTKDSVSKVRTAKQTYQHVNIRC